MKPRFEDGRVAIYTTAPEAGHDFTLLTELEPGLGPTAVRLSANCINPGQPLIIDVDWGTTKVLTQDFMVQFSLDSPTGQSYSSDPLPVLDNWPTSQWPENTLARGYYTWLLSAEMETAVYNLQLSLVNTTTSSPVMTVQPVTVQSDACDLPTIPGATVVNGRFGEEMRLLAYQAQLGESQLQLTLHWRGERRMTTDYKVFVHLFDPATDVPAAQDDAVPRQWQFPTTFWWPGDVITDVISIPLTAVPAGQYGLAVGVYDPLAGTRLPVMDEAGRVRADGRLILPEMVAIEP
jgi:hypothetical protein